MTDDEHGAAITDRVRCTGRRTCASARTEPTNERLTDQSRLGYATTETHLLERWLAEGSRGDCTQGSAEQGVKRRDGEGMEDGRSVRERGS